ncbi:MAG: TrkH family potassium uptake protein, partial [Sphaerochaetaceae bacterium]|nr:TrkH family potassium uptake protein [Sphaerochaetaceae bacterium]
EVMSGFTTTGATTLTNIEGCTKAVLFWRSMTNWLGGMGIVVLFVALLPVIGAGAKLGAGTFHLMGAESVGPIKGKLTPKTRTTALVLWAIYIGLTLLETVILLFGGLSFYEAITVSFSTLAAAGFCIKNASIGGFASVYVDIVVTIFMFLAGINFSLYYRAFTSKIKNVVKDSELRWYTSIILICSLLSAIQLTIMHTYGSFFEALRYTLFMIISIITTTGFSIADYTLWPTFAVMLVIICMFIGGCAGSTGGGIKVVRVSTILKSGLNAIKKRNHPHAIVKVRTGNEIISDDTVSSITAFCAVYIITWLLSAVIIGLTGVDIETCLASTLLTLGNVGIGFGKVGPSGNFGFFPAWSKWLFSFLMLVGRLELFTVYVLFTKSFWKK